VDAGIGFDPEGPTARHGLGLIGMRERIGLIHGELVVESRRGTGTRIHVSVPLHYGNRLPADRVALTDPHLGSGAQLDELNA
jgi:glucose-6-phosphate-specific signal transduction histidine kinase